MRLIQSCDALDGLSNKGREILAIILQCPDAVQALRAALESSKPSAKVINPGLFVVKPGR
jgi:hypothetical protein